MTPNYTIQGQLPFQGPGNPLTGAQGGLQGLADQYAQSYNSALGQNQAMYNNILAGYQQTMQNQVSAQDAIGQGYNQLYNNVLGGIQGIGASQSQAIADAYAQQAGALQQQLTNSGLGNTTVSGQMQRGPMLDAQKAQVALANQLAQLTAGYQSNLGMAGLNQQNMANMQNTALSNQQLNWMNSVTAAYPNAQDYYGLYAQQGQWDQARQDRDLALTLARMGQASVAPAGVSSRGPGLGAHGGDLQQPIGTRGGGSPDYGPSPILSSRGSAGTTGPGGYVPLPWNPASSPGYQAGASAPSMGYGVPGWGSAMAGMDAINAYTGGGSLGYGGVQYNPYADLGDYDNFGGQGYDPYAGGYDAYGFDPFAAAGIDESWFYGGGGGGGGDDYTWWY